MFEVSFTHRFRLVGQLLGSQAVAENWLNILPEKQTNKRKQSKCFGLTAFLSDQLRSLLLTSRGSQARCTDSIFQHVILHSSTVSDKTLSCFIAILITQYFSFDYSGVKALPWRSITWYEELKDSSEDAYLFYLSTWGAVKNIKDGMLEEKQRIYQSDTTLILYSEPSKWITCV